MANSIDNISKYAVNFIGFDDVSTNTYDAIDGNVGTFTGATRVTGWNGEGYAVNFNGTSQYVLFGSRPILPQGTFSLRLKYKIPNFSTSKGMVIMSNRHLTTAKGIQIWIDTAGKLNVGFAYTKTWDLALISTDVVTGNFWRDLLITFDADSSKVKVYLDDMVNPIMEGELTNAVYEGTGLILGRLRSSGDNYLNGQLDQIEVYDRVISAINDKYLVLHNSEHKYHDGTTWQVVDATEENFIQFGMEQLSQITEAQWDELGDNVTVVMWSDFEDKQYINVVLERDEYTAKDLLGEEYNVVVLKNDKVEQQQLLLDAIGLPQTVYPLSDISLLGIKDITSITLTATGNGKIAISVDSGATWNTFDGTQWLVITDISQGMAFTDFNNLTIEQIEGLLGDSQFIRFAYYLTGDTEINEVVMKVSTEGVPEFANKNDYDLSYDINTKTITYVINKSGEYIINYTDAE